MPFDHRLIAIDEARLGGSSHVQVTLVNRAIFFTEHKQFILGRSFYSNQDERREPKKSRRVNTND